MTKRRLAERSGLAALVVLAMALRAAHLGWPPLWVDEAESALNALTIVAEGVPRDHYLGIPLFENTLARPWPESAEYEFKDISYSDRGLSIYHGWLPLYAIAGAFRLAGVTPEAARSGTPPADGSTPELVRWTAVPRWPSIVFSGLFVLAAFGLGRRVGGTEVGWATALAAGLANIFVWFGRQARYYSATLALNAASGLAIWNACRRGRLRDYALAGLAIGLLFHTHALAAVTMAGVFVAALPLARRQPRLWLRVAVAAGVAGMLVLPWARWSGFLGQMTHIPPARRYLDVKALLWSLPSTDPVVLLTCALGLAWFATAALVGNRLGERWRRPFLDQAPAFYFAIVWLALSYAVFVVAVPAASYFEMRLKLSVAVPGLLVNALVIGAASRAFRPQSRLLPSGGHARAAHPLGPDPSARRPPDGAGVGRVSGRPARPFVGARPGRAGLRGAQRSPAPDLLHGAARAEHQPRAQGLARPLRRRPRDHRWPLVRITARRRGPARSPAGRASS